MNQCYKPGDFYKYFEENMRALGLSAPRSLFETAEKATATATILVTALTQLGKNATVAELIGATTGLEKLVVVGALFGAGYAGAVVGSIVVASGRTLACGASIADALWYIRQNGIDFPNSLIFFKSNPEILNREAQNRMKFSAKCKQMNNYGYVCR
ncbi:hypothetical protein [Photobacterium sanctipauli]|uniref:hypothetical protein n=1 Tax=Photobacterium sanctipauli TaxID=1342794 RepID=UPI00068F02B2|nr:hypothetical protein [Photobacterium sanctipauli]